jgi:RNA polymerase I-specific transcription initiation factor RRN6
MNRLAKARPELFPANEVAAAILATPSTSHPSLPPIFGHLLAIGKAVDADQKNQSRKTTLIAMPCGEAGHALRLIRPHSDKYAWGAGSAARLSLIDIKSSDQGYWVGTGGTILQILFADENETPTVWLAVRQARMVTIFRPTCGSELRFAVAPDYLNSYPPSRIYANPVAVLTSERCGAGDFVDTSFNPWYARQFAVVDQMGFWSVWNIESKRNRSSSLSLVPGRSGRIFDGFMPDPNLNELGNADGWHKILWIGTVSMIVVCNRRQLALFSIKTLPTRLSSPKLLAANNSDWILDMKRSPTNSCHLFVLTSSRICLLEVTPNEDYGHYGARILLSHRHFKDVNDETLKIVICKDNDGKMFRRATALNRTNPMQRLLLLFLEKVRCSVYIAFKQRMNQVFQNAVVGGAL